MKSKKGFIQIPLLIAIIAGVLVIGGAGYLGYKQLRSFQAQQVEQQKQLEKNQSEILTLQKGAQKQASSSILQKPKSGFHPVIFSPKDNTISAQDIAPYLNGVVQITCYNQSGDQLDTGSGVLKRYYPKNYTVLTNRHVIEDLDCDFAINGPETGMYTLSITERGPFNYYTDVSLAKIDLPETQRTLGNGLIIKNNPNPPSLNSLDYAIGDLRNCSKKILVGSPVAVIGYPANGMLADQGGANVQFSHQIVTFGAISGYDEAPYSDGLPDVNYFVTAQMDAGNSGGAAIAKDNSGLCFLGLPTWVNRGEYANTGMVQSVSNVFYQK